MKLDGKLHKIAANFSRERFFSRVWKTSFSKDSLHVFSRRFFHCVFHRVFHTSFQTHFSHVLHSCFHTCLGPFLSPPSLNILEPSRSFVKPRGALPSCVGSCRALQTLTEPWGSAVSFTEPYRALPITQSPPPNHASLLKNTSFFFQGERRWEGKAMIEWRRIRGEAVSRAGRAYVVLCVFCDILQSWSSENLRNTDNNGLRYLNILIMHLSVVSLVG